MGHKKTLYATIAACVSAAVVVGVVVFNVGMGAGDIRWATNEKLEKVTGEIYKELEVASKEIYEKIEQLDINSLDRQITFLQIKIDQQEATTSEKIYIEALRLQLRALQPTVRPGQ